MARRSVALLVWFVLAWFAVSPRSHAQETAARPAPSPVAAAELPRVIVSARRMPGETPTADAVPANATVMTAEEIQHSGASTVQELLARLEGVALMDTRGFGVGSDSSLSLRGISNGSRTNALVLVDGVRQNRLTGDEVHWQSIPLSQVERIELIRGGGGTIYGEGALAGVINIYTKQESDRPLAVEEGVELGSYGWQRYSLAARGRSERFGYGTSYTRRLLEGYREFSASRNTTITAHGRVELLPAAHLSVNVLHSEDTSSFPGGLTLAQTEQRRRQADISRIGVFDDETNQVALEAVLGPYHGLSWLIGTFWRGQEVDSRRSGLFTLTPSRGLNLRSSHEWTGANTANLLISGFELVDDKASTGTRGDRTDESNREGYGFYVEDTLTLWDRLSLAAGFRYDRAHFEEDIIAFDSNTFTNVNYVGTLQFEGKAPKVGLTYALLPERAWCFTSYSRPFKAPNVDDFASRSPEFKGNIALQPQQADVYEVGGRLRAGPATANATWFYTRIQDEILFVQGIPGNPFLFQNQNHDTRRVGFETAAQVTLPRLRGRAAYTFIDAEFRKGDFAGNTLPATPEHLFNAGVGVSPVESLWIDLDWQLVHDVFRINDVVNILPADNYGVLNLTVQYTVPNLGGRPHASTRAYVTFQNLTGEEYVSFASSNGHTLATGAGENPMPPFNVLGGVSIEF